MGVEFGHIRASDWINKFSNSCNFLYVQCIDPQPFCTLVLINRGRIIDLMTNHIQISYGPAIKLYEADL